MECHGCRHRSCAMHSAQAEQGGECGGVCSSSRSCACCCNLLPSWLMLLHIRLTARNGRTNQMTPILRRCWWLVNKMLRTVQSCQKSRDGGTTRGPVTHPPPSEQGTDRGANNWGQQAEAFRLRYTACGLCALHALLFRDAAAVAAAQLQLQALLPK